MPRKWYTEEQIISILGKQISAELHLSKTQFGLLGGTSFALLSSATYRSWASLPHATEKTEKTMTAALKDRMVLRFI